LTRMGHALAPEGRRAGQHADVFSHIKDLQFEAKPDGPDAAFARRLQEALGGRPSTVDRCRRTPSARVAARCPWTAAECPGPAPTSRRAEVCSPTSTSTSPPRRRAGCSWRGFGLLGREPLEFRPFPYAAMPSPEAAAPILPSGDPRLYCS
jgi:hypothetical protein